MGNRHHKQQQDSPTYSKRARYTQWLENTGEHQTQTVSRKSQRAFTEHQRSQDLHHLPIEIVSRITTFLNIKEIVALMQCNVRIYTMVNGEASGIAYNFHVVHLSPSIEWDESLKSNFKKQLLQLNNTNFDWLSLHKREFLLKKVCGPLIKLSRPSLSLPSLSDESQNLTGFSEFQQRAQKNLEISNNLNWFSQEGLDIAKQIINNKTQVHENLLQQDLPHSLKRFIAIRLQMNFYTSYYRQVILEATRVDDKMLCFQILNLAWTRYVQMFLEEGQRSFAEVKSFVTTAQTFTDMMIEDWCFSKEILTCLVSSFSDGLTRMRRQQVQQEHIQQHQKQVLQRTFSVFLDLSCTSEEVRNLSMPNFYGNELFRNCIEQSNCFLLKLHEYCENNFSNDVESAISIFQKDAELLRYIFGDWVIQDFIEQKHIQCQKLLLKNFLKRQHENINLIKIEDEVEEPFQETTPQLDMNSSTISLQSIILDQKISAEPDLLVTLIQEGIKEIKCLSYFESSEDRQSFLDCSLVSEASTHYSSLSSSQLGGSQQDLGAEQLASYVRKNHPFVVQAVSQIQRQQAALSYQTEQRRFKKHRISSQVGSLSQMIQAELNL